MDPGTGGTVHEAPGLINTGGMGGCDSARHLGIEE